MDYNGTQDEAYTPTLRDKKREKAGQVAASAVGAAGDITQGIMQSVDNRRARDEAREIAKRNRQDSLALANTSFRLARKRQDLEEKEFALRKQANLFDLQHTQFERLLKRSFAMKEKRLTAARSFAGAMKNNPSFIKGVQSLVGAGGS